MTALATLIAQARLPYCVPTLDDGPPLRVEVGDGVVLVDGVRLAIRTATDLSRAIRCSLEGRVSRTVRPRERTPLMVCRISDDLVRVDGRRIARPHAVRLSVALDMAAAQAAGLLVVEAAPG
ncbi:hypothetical protein E1091_01300 [Micromonospora fluostatini]|uniref:Uncharacterized protein n=1 Tax=Micromonospora fluostatini TaxID=1629071 RepID=A0ABY2DLM7_9ACTN|nr:hypothetical protein E1091_01300 [Micromonospora fluostatini]